MNLCFSFSNPALWNVDLVGDNIDLILYTILCKGAHNTVFVVVINICDFAYYNVPYTCRFLGPMIFKMEVELGAGGSDYKHIQKNSDLSLLIKYAYINMKKRW